MNYQDIQRKHYNKIAGEYLKKRNNKNTVTYRSVLWSEFLRLVNLNLRSKTNLVACEAMCGTCEGSKRMSQLIADSFFYAFDYSDKMVEEAKSTKLNNNNKIRVEQMDIVKFNDKNKYDFVILIGGLHHIFRSAGPVVKNIYRSLKPGGIFINFEPTNNFFLLGKIRDYIYHKNKIFESNTEHDFSLTDYCKFFSETNFKIVKQFYPGLLGYVLYYNPDAFPFLNLGNQTLAKVLAKMDIFLGRTVVGKIFSFNSFTIAKK